MECIVLGVAKSWTQLSDFHEAFMTYISNILRTLKTHK